MGLTSRCATFTAISCGLAFVAMVFHVVAFGTRRWIESKENSPFRSIGFHEACFTECSDPYCPASGSRDVMYDGCSRLEDWYFQEIWQWLMPDWFITARNLCIVNVPLICVCFILLAVCVCLAFAGRYTTEGNVCREKSLIGLLFTSAALQLGACIVNLVLMMLMYTYGFQRSWMPMPEKNGYGYSFWLTFTGTLLLTVSVFLTTLAGATKVLWLYGDKDPRYSEDMMMARGQSGLGPRI